MNTELPYRTGALPSLSVRVASRGLIVDDFFALQRERVTDSEARMPHELNQGSYVGLCVNAAMLVWDGSTKTQEP